MKNLKKKAWAAVLRVAMPVLLAFPVATQAAVITGVSLQKSAKGDVLTIRSDEELDYQSFDLSAPPRLVLTFPKATVKKGVQGVKSNKPGVRGVAVSASGKGARLDVSLSKATPYKTMQKGNTLVFQFAPMASSAAAKAGKAAVIKDLVLRDRGETTELVLRGEHMDASHDAFVTNQGRTLILDYWGASSRLPKEHYAAATQKVSGVTVGEAKGRVRLVVDLLPGVSEKHQIDASDKQLVVRFGSVAPKRKAPKVMVEDVKFQPKDRIARLVIRTNVSNPIVDLHEERGAAVLDIRKAALAKGQERSLDVSAFPGPLKQVDAYTIGDKVRIVARLRDKVEISSFQSGNVLTISYVPKDIAMAKRGAQEGEAFAYTGQKVSFDYQGINIRNALRLIAEMSDMNIIMGDDVQGKLNMHLENVPWDQALDIILESQGLGKEQKGNVLRIAPLAVLAKERQSRLAARKSEAELAPLITEFISLSFAKADEVKTMLEAVSSGTSSTTSGSSGSTAPSTASSGGSKASKNSGLLSPRGTLVVDSRTNTLIIKDTKESINNIKRLIARIDKPVKQVLIEARIVEATDDFTRELGVSWGGQVSGHGGRVTNQISNNSAGGGGFLVDLPAPNSASTGGQIGLAVGALNSAFNLKLELSAAEADDKIKIVSNPRVVTTNLKAASINQGSDIPFQTSSANGGTNVEFKKANLGLTVTPQITADNRIMLKVNVTKDSVSQTAQVGGNPIINTKQIDTEIFINNGETIVIGGIYTRNKSKNVAGVPGFSKIPLLGWLFKKNIKTDKKTELLIFLTPTILKSSLLKNHQVAQAL